MVSADLFDMIVLRLEQAAFDGVVMVVGDFLQLPPVVRGASEVHFAFESQGWCGCQFVTIELTHIYRTDDKAFIELLHRVRFAEIDEEVHHQLNAYIKPLPCELSHYTFLFGKNISASHYNKEQLEKLEGDLFVQEVQIVEHKKGLKPQMVDRFLEDARIEKELYLKVGAPVLFTRNAWNYFNGQRGVVLQLDENYVYVQKDDGKVVKLERVVQEKTQWSEKTIQGKQEMVEEAIVSAYQFPIKLAYAITIHKSQGMSIENLIIQTNEIFAPSQFYVALSRSSNPLTLILLAPQKQWYALAFSDPKALHFVRKGVAC
jgi:ATP-dependent exoDNAse (exonuclease V) alpha subunit